LPHIVANFLAPQAEACYLPPPMGDTAGDLLREELEQRQRKNPAYSLRSFAHLLNIDAGSLSGILNGRRKLPARLRPIVAARLALNPSRTQVLSRSKFRPQKLARIKIKPVKTRLVDSQHYRVLSEWEHFAVLSLLKTKDFESSATWIAKKLGLSKIRTEGVLARLEAASLIKKDSNNQWSRSWEALTTTEDIRASALQASHAESLKLASSALRELDIADRDFSSITMALSHKKLAFAKNLIREFRKKLASLMEDGNEDTVYRMSIQLFPLSIIPKENLSQDSKKRIAKEK
jgi:uncharacterized protein (TIGR02147 family)